jgi:hypothetical protein
MRRGREEEMEEKGTEEEEQVSVEKEGKILG